MYISNKKIPLVTCREKIDYISAACLYCWHQWVSKAGIALQDASFKVARLIISLLLPKKKVYKAYRNHLNERQSLNVFFRDIESGNDIRIAKNMVFFTFCGYLAFLGFILYGTICSLVDRDLFFLWKGGLISIVTLLMMLGLIFLVNIKLTNVINEPHLYLTYFKEFNKRDEKWLKKWKKKTLLLYVGSILSAVAGVMLS